MRAMVLRIINRLFYFGSGPLISRPQEHFRHATKTLTNEKLNSKSELPAVVVRIGRLFAKDQMISKSKDSTGNCNMSSNSSYNSTDQSQASAAVVVLHSSHSRQMAYYFEDMFVRWHGLNRLNSKAVSYSLINQLNSTFNTHQCTVIPFLIAKLICSASSVQPVPWNQYSFMVNSAAMTTSVLEKGLPVEQAKLNQPYMGFCNPSVSSWVPCFHAYSIIKTDKTVEPTIIPLHIAKQIKINGKFGAAMAHSRLVPLKTGMYKTVEDQLQKGRKKNKNFKL